MKWTLTGLLLAIALPIHICCLAQNLTISVLELEFPASDGRLNTNYVVYPGDVVFVSVRGEATFGMLAKIRLGAINAAGSGSVEYLRSWGKEEYQGVKFGGMVCRVGASAKEPVQGDFKDCLFTNFQLGVCPVNPNPVPGALMKVKEQGKLWFDINDQWPLDNAGSYYLTIVIYSSHLPPYNATQYVDGNDYLCKFILSVNQYGTGYNGARMEAIAKSGRTEELGDFREINSFYRFLNEHPAVRGTGVRWQQVAIEVTGMMLQGNRLLEELRTPGLSIHTNLTKLVFLDTYLLLTSAGGRNFIEGVASRGLVRDVTRKFYTPLLNGQVAVKNPLYFDLAAVYAEQYHPDLVRYYNGFNFFDRVLIEGFMAKLFAGKAGCLNGDGMTSLDAEIHIGNPRDRVRIGLFKMGYTAVQMDQAMTKLDALIDRGYSYQAIVENLSGEAFARR